MHPSKRLADGTPASQGGRRHHSAARLADAIPRGMRWTPTIRAGKCNGARPGRRAQIRGSLPVDISSANRSIVHMASTSGRGYQRDVDCARAFAQYRWCLRWCWGAAGSCVSGRGADPIVGHVHTSSCQALANPSRGDCGRMPDRLARAMIPFFP